MKGVAEKALAASEAEVRLVRMLKALGNLIRFQIMKTLAECRTCIIQEIVETTPLAQSTVSQHIAALESELGVKLLDRTGRGALLTGDTISVAADRRWVTFMRSYPNHIPLSEKAVRAIEAALIPLAFDRVYSHFFERDIQTGAKQILQRSVERYIAAIKGAYDQA